MKCTHLKIKLEKNGINVTIRREMGRDIDGVLWTVKGISIWRMVDESNGDY